MDEDTIKYLAKYYIERILEKETRKSFENDAMELSEKMEMREDIHLILKNYDINILCILEIIQNFLNNNTLVIVSGVSDSGKTLLSQIVKSFIKDFVCVSGVWLEEVLAAGDMPLIGGSAKSSKFYFINLPFYDSDTNLQKYIDDIFLPGVARGYCVWVDIDRETKLDLSKYNHIRLWKKQRDKFTGNFKNGFLSDSLHILTDIYTFEKERMETTLLCLNFFMSIDMIYPIIKLLY